MGRGGGENLAQRVANTRAREAGINPDASPYAAPTPPTIGSPAPPPGVKHAWYDGPYGRQPALLLKWRNIQGRYDGLICVAAPDGVEWALIEMWVDGAMLAPV